MPVAKKKRGKECYGGGTACLMREIYSIEPEGTNFRTTSRIVIMYAAKVPELVPSLPFPIESCSMW